MPHNRQTVPIIDSPYTRVSRSERGSPQGPKLSPRQKSGGAMTPTERAPFQLPLKGSSDGRRMLDAQLPPIDVATDATPATRISVFPRHFKQTHRPSGLHRESEQPDRLFASTGRQICVMQRKLSADWCLADAETRTSALILESDLICVE